MKKAYHYQAPAAIAFLLLMLLAASVACTSPLIANEEENDDPSPADSTGTSQRDTLIVLHTGSDEDPYTVAEALWTATATEVWVEGYVVGTVKGSMNSGCTFEPPFEVASNVLMADTFPCAAEACLPVELKSGSIYQYSMNLVDNPTGYHEKHRVKGDLTSYYRTTGIRNVSTVSRVHEEAKEEENGSDDDESGENSISNPLTISEATALQTADGSGEMMWVRGIIVGWSPRTNRTVLPDSLPTSAEPVRTNVVLADSIGESDPEHLLVVKLPEGCVRNDVNLADNPSNLHRTLTVKGYLQSVNGMSGCVDILGASRREDLTGHPLYRIE